MSLRTSAPAPAGTTHSTRWALLASLAAPVWFFGWMVLIAALRPDYSHATNAISELGAWGTPHMEWWNTLGFVGTGLALFGFAWAYRKVLGSEAVGSVALALTALLFCLTAIPIVIGADGDPDLGSRWTQAHLVAVLLGPAPWLYATVRIAVRYRRGPWKRLSLLSALAAVGLILALFASITQILPQAPGLLQRLSFVPYLGWYAVASWTLLGGSR